MAREDLSVAYSIFNSDQHAASVFYAELASQKAVKALIAASGFEPGKTHRPTVVLKALISSRIVDLPVPLLLLQLGVACSIWSRGVLNPATLSLLESRGFSLVAVYHL